MSRIGIPADLFEDDPLYVVALEEIVEVIPPELPDNTRIRLDDVRSLMIACWLRGAHWQQLREKSDAG